MVDLIARMLEYDPTKRISLAEAINHPFFDVIPPDRRLVENNLSIWVNICISRNLLVRDVTKMSYYSGLDRSRCPLLLALKYFDLLTQL